MATKLKITKLEDEVIAMTIPAIEDALASSMDQILETFERSQILTVPAPQFSSTLVDALTIGWSGGVEVGTEMFEDMVTKAYNGLQARSVAAYLARYGRQQASKIITTTSRQLRDTILEGQRAGQSPLEITRALINRVPKIARQRAKIIATTEVHAAAQFGLLRAASQSNKVLTKVWVSVEDDRVRDFARNSDFSHMQTHGQAQAVDGLFRIPRVGGTYEALEFPGDPNGSAGNIINCRCTMEFREV
jgi:hypothetical protein